MSKDQCCGKWKRKGKYCKNCPELKDKSEEINKKSKEEKMELKKQIKKVKKEFKKQLKREMK